ncbi:M23 family peptidase [Pseudolabrys taiwanensis]|uniref:M23 family peptidase n=2 Tax=Pseudolabrys taiwanensis TaxID=331696 RepID=A0A345ZU07_9HYPH|nr:M23 family metallopeptidase [Pseudolabrys taiwanensis]AXK80404.1 M23 family peptidase [Pseudolabrys taiwanensis]
MSYSSYSSHHPHIQAARARPLTAAAMSRQVPRASHDYTLTHHGRQVRIGPVAFWIVVGTLVVMAVWSIATGTYFAFREDVLTRLIGRQAEMQFAYEDRIAELRAQVDRITSRQLLDQEQFEQKLNALLKRQATLEQRTNSLTADSLTTGTVKPARTQPTPEAPAPKLRSSSLTGESMTFMAPPDQLQWRDAATDDARTLSRAKAGGLEGTLARVSLSLDKVEKRQTTALSEAEDRVEGKAARLHSVLSELGVNVGKAPARGVGGPFVPVKPLHPTAGDFERQIYRINVAKAQLDRYTNTLTTVPVRKPITGEIELSSTFGVRLDPFLRRPAMHTGLDMRGDTGDPVYATASGKVSVAGREGGYGNMVEIEHGHGFATRYGHLSAIEVKVGQQVRIGQIIGRIGSTGRSTGPHLHYETRINDEPVDPQRFLKAGAKLGLL